MENVTGKFKSGRVNEFKDFFGKITRKKKLVIIEKVAEWYLSVNGGERGCNTREPFSIRKFCFWANDPTEHV